MQLQSIKEIEEYLRNYLRIPYVNLEGIDVSIGNEIINVLSDVFYLYPMLKETICTIGQPDDINNQANLLLHSTEEAINNGFEAFGWAIVDDSKGTLGAYRFKERKNVEYVGISLEPYLIGKNLEQVNRIILEDSKRGFKPQHYRTFRSSLMHEIGHVLDYILKISEKSEFIDLIENRDIEKEISIYATVSPMETLAESFAEYYATDAPSPLVNDIVGLINSEYEIRANKKSEVFNISSRYR